MARGGEGVRIEGLNKKTKQLQDFGLALDDLKDATAAVAREGAEAVREYVPIGETGVLAADVRGNRAKNKATVTSGRARVPYAGPVNYGWPSRGIEPAEYMQKGDQDMQPIAVRLWEDGIESAARRKGLT